MQTRTAQLILRGVGVLSLVAAAVGLLYNFETMRTFQAPTSATHAAEFPQFRNVFLIMWSLCVLCYLTLAFCGIQFLRLKVSVWRWFAAAVAIEVTVSVVAVFGGSWFDLGITKSIAAAVPESSAGLTIQWLVLFPLWAPLAVWLAYRRLGVG